MASTTGLSTTTAPEPMAVDYTGGGQYVVGGEPKTEAEVNAVLEAYGIKANNGEYTTLDGVTLSAGDVSAVTSFGGDAPLPDVDGVILDSSTLALRVEWAENIEDGALMWAALSELARTSMREMKDAKELKNAFELQKIQAKKSQINATEKQIEAERSAAFQSMMWSIAGAVVGAVLGAVGGSGSGKAAGAAAGASTAAGAAVSKAGEYISKAHGPQREADDKRVEGQRWEMMEAMMDQGIDSARSNYEEAREQFKAALKIIDDHSERNSQVVQRITS